MNIAVLVYGRLNKCVEHYNNIIEAIGNDNNIDFFLSSDNPDEKLLNDFIDLYKPILYNNSSVIYTNDLTPYPGNIPKAVLHNMICHFTNKNRVFVLLEKYITGRLDHVVVSAAVLAVVLILDASSSLGLRPFFFTKLS